MTRYGAIWPDALNLRPARRDACIWRDCDNTQFADTPLCVRHATYVYSQVKDALSVADDVAQRLKTTPPQPSQSPRHEPVPFVYYLMMGPATVKIGTTIRLRERITGLQSDLQYVVALEIGGLELEHQRHEEFAADRISPRREHFRLSDRLKAHIETLMDQRDELVALAAQPGGYRTALKR